MTKEWNTKQKRIFRGAVAAAAVLVFAAVAFAGAAGADVSQIKPETVASYSGVYFYNDISKQIETDLTVTNAVLIANEANWRYIVNATNNGSTTEYLSANMVLTDNIEFTDEVASLGNNTLMFNGSIYGNGKIISNFTQSGDLAHGLIWYAKDGCVLNYVQMTGSNIYSDDCDLAAFIGDPRDANDKGIKFSGCSVSWTTITSKIDSVGGFIGYSKNANIWINDSSVNHLQVKSLTKGDLGGLAGYTYSTGTLHIADSQVVDCEIFGNGGIGGVIGHVNIPGSVVNVTVKDTKIISSSNGAGGIFGCGYERITYDKCTVNNCTIDVQSSGVGGIVGLVSYTHRSNFTHCEVVNCEKISGSTGVGGIVGANLYSTSWSMRIFVNYSTVRDSTIIGTGVSSPVSATGGLIGTSSITSASDLNNNTLENVVIKATNVGGVQYAYLFDVSKYPINSSGGIAKLARVNLANDNKIINSYVFDDYYKVENTKLDGFTGLTTEFSIDVSNPKVTSIEDNTFKNSKLTGLFNISSVTMIKSDAFSGSNLTGGFYIPAATLGTDVFTGTKLQAIYGDTTSVALPASIAKINITAAGELTSILPGSFTVKDDNVFEDVTLGSAPAKYFQNISSVSPAYLFASESWNAGNTYLALAAAGTEITLDPVDGTGSAPVSVVALPGNKNLSSSVTAPEKAGYTFGGWYNETTGGVLVINASTGKLNASAEGYTDADGFWTNPASALTLYANWTVNQTTKAAESNVSVFGNDNFTMVRDDAVISILLETVNNVTGTVTFTADNASVSSVLQTISGMNVPVTVSIFDITAANDGSGTTSSFYVNVTFANLADKDKVKFFHYTVGSGWDSKPLTSSIAAEYASENKVLYKVETDSFSPFGIGIYTPTPSPAPQSSSSHSSRNDGYSVILQETAQPTPTPVPIAEPTQAAPVASPVKPQPTQTSASPAPFVGILAGLGAAAVLFGLRRT